MKIICSVLLVIFCSVCSLAQQKKVISRDTINLTGFIYDNIGKPVNSLHVKSTQLETAHNSFKVETYTNERGYFELKGAKYNDTITIGPDIHYDALQYYNRDSRYMIVYLPAAKLTNITPGAPFLFSQKRKYPKVVPSFTVEPMNDISNGDNLITQAEYPGGIGQLEDFIKKNMVYPDRALKNNAEGTIEVLFTVGKDGGVSDLKILRGIGYDCEEEVIHALKRAKKWKPAIDHGGPVAVQEVVAVQFKLTDNL